MTWLQAEGFRLALPVMQGRGKPLLDAQLGAGRRDELRPRGELPSRSMTNPHVDPDVVLVPLLAFDARGYRIGYGGGFYDRTLQRLRKLKPVVAIGLAYDEQRVDAVPVESYDERLDWVLTPSGPLHCLDSMIRTS